MNRWLAFLILLLASCQEQQTSNTKTLSVRTETLNVPVANTIVASDSMRIPDSLNELYYSIKVIATDQTAQGVYNVLVNYGFNDASTQITLPDADEPIIPRVRRGAAERIYIIGFNLGKDTTFYDYFLIKASGEKTEMKYIKAYSFQ